MKIFSLILFVSIVFFSFKGNNTNWIKADKNEVLTSYGKGVDWFNQTSNFKITIEYASYINYNINTSFEKSIGYYEKENNSFKSVGLGINTIQNEKVRITIDTVNRMIILNDKLKNNQNPVDMKGFSDLLDRVQSIKKHVEESGNIVYRIEFKPNNLYDMYEFGINSKGLLTSMKYYYSKAEKENESDIKAVKSKPRAEILFSDYKTNVEFNYEREFSERNYLNLEGKKVTLNQKYKSYVLKDYRFEEKK